MLFISAPLLKTIILQYNNNKTHILGTITVVAYAETYQQYWQIMENMIFAGTCPSLLSLSLPLSSGIFSIILYRLFDLCCPLFGRQNANLFPYVCVKLPFNAVICNCKWLFMLIYLLNVCFITIRQFITSLKKTNRYTSRLQKSDFMQYDSTVA